MAAGRRERGAVEESYGALDFFCVCFLWLFFLCFRIYGAFGDCFGRLFL